VDVAGQRPAALRTLGEELARLGDYPAGIALLRRAQQQYPDNVLLNARLARLLHSQRPPQWEEALRFATAAIALRPRSPGLLVEYAYLLMRRDRMDESMAMLEKAVAVKPDHPVALAELGIRLREKGEKERSMVLTQKALELFRQAIATDPDNDLHYYDEGLTLLNLGDPDRATQALRKAVELNPNFGECRRVMAEALAQLGLLDEALRAIREAVRLDPGNADFQNVLAVMLLEQGGPMNEAVAAIDQSLLIYPSTADYRLTLAEVLRAQGKIRESLEAYKNGQRLHETNARRWDWSPQVGQWVKNAERLEELDRLLPAIRKGERKPASAAEYAECGQLCVYKGLYAASAEFYQQAFTLDVTLADDLGAGLRYQAARAAAMAGCGHDTENDKLDDAARARWRRQARDWLSADLTLRRKQLERGKPEDRKAVQYTLNHMRTHDHLAGIRDSSALTRLQQPEQAECQRLWSQVELLLKQAQQPQP
jgi:tetratricopeptide (TPR) repeat protein